MTQIRFAKMHGLGNDFMVIDATTEAFTVRPEQIRSWGERHTGIGFDQLLLLEPSTRADCLFRYRIFNCDGSEVEHCGNGARCVAEFVRRRGLTQVEDIPMQTARGRIILTHNGDFVRVDMGAPDFSPSSLPFNAASQALSYRLDIDGVGDVHFGAVSVGNPHIVLLVDSVANADVLGLGQKLTTHPAFPAGVNVGFLQRISADEGYLRVFERGVGETRACGTGACAATAVGIHTGIFNHNVLLHLQGGDLQLSWAGAGQPLLMSGPATHVYEGVIDDD